MKTMKCDMCDKEFSGETFEEWFSQMKEHYMTDHADFMKEAENKAKEDPNKAKEEGMKWMSDMKAKWEAL